MANPEREAAIAKANDLGLEFAGNISTAKLLELIAEAQGPAVKDDEDSTNQVDTNVLTTGAAVEVVDPKKPLADLTQTELVALKKVNKRRYIAAKKAKALKTRIVTITNKDNRENDVTTTAPLSFENEYFGIAKNVPLDMAVELEQALIDIAESTTITQHRDEVIDGKRTGNKIPVQAKKYVVSYSKEQAQG